MKANSNLPQIESIEQFDAYINVNSTPFNKLSAKDLEKFKSDVIFISLDILNLNTKEVKKIVKISSINWMIPVVKYNFTVLEMEEAALIFGISPENLWANYHRFGDLLPPGCNPRPFFYCGINQP
jgi:hypothetical protein